MDFYMGKPRPRGAEKLALEEIVEFSRSMGAPRYFFLIGRHLERDHGIGANHADFEQKRLDHLAAWHACKLPLQQRVVRVIASGK